MYWGSRIWPVPSITACRYTDPLSVAPAGSAGCGSDSGFAASARTSSDTSVVFVSHVASAYEIRTVSPARSVVSANAAATLPASADSPDLMPYSAAGKKVLELTFREALRLGHNYIGTEHILLALLEHENGEGPLSGLGVTKPGVERFVAEALATVTIQKKA